MRIGLTDGRRLDADENLVVSWSFDLLDPQDLGRAIARVDLESIAMRRFPSSTSPVSKLRPDANWQPRATISVPTIAASEHATMDRVPTATGSFVNSRSSVQIRVSAPLPRFVLGQIATVVGEGRRAANHHGESPSPVASVRPTRTSPGLTRSTGQRCVTAAEPSSRPNRSRSGRELGRRGASPSARVRAGRRRPSRGTRRA
jgi:hypothetical protein